MTKRIIAGLLTVGILGGLAYYSGTLYSEHAGEEELLSLQGPMTLPIRQASLEQAREQEEKEQQERAMEAARREASAEAVRDETEAYLYYLVFEAGHVKIYLGDRETLYEETEITLDNLPDDLKEEVLRGKGLKSPGELYDFLENYSS